MARGSYRGSLACQFKSRFFNIEMTKTIELDLFPNGAAETHSPYCQRMTNANPRKQMLAMLSE